jgi:hypothetical protein
MAGSKKSKTLYIMKKALLLASMLPIALLMTGCETTGLSSREQNTGYSTLVSGYYQNTPGENSTMPVKAPITLAVAQIGETAPEAAFTKALMKDPKLVRNVVAIPMPGVNQSRHQNGGTEPATDVFAGQVKSARNLARDLGAGYLLLVGGSIDSHSSRNVLSPLDLTIVGAAVLPGTKVHADGKAAGALVDVETGKITFLSNVELQKTGLTPTYYAEEKRDSLNVKLRGEVLQKLAADVLEKLEQHQSKQVSTIGQ